LTNQIRLDQENIYAHYRVGLLMTVLEPEQALPELMLASSLDPETDSAVQTLRAALNLSATQTAPAEKMLSIGRALGLVQEWELAVAAFEKAVSEDPRNAEAWAWLGEAKQQTGQDGSVELDRAASLQDSSVIVHALRGLYWNRQKQYLKMLAEYQRAAELEPDNPAWQAELGNAYSRMDDLASAFSAYQHATVLAPNDATYWRLLAVFCAENGIYLEETGLPAAQKALELSPDDPFVQDALGWSYLSSGRYANAEQVLKNTVTLFPDHLPARIHLAMTYLAQGDRSAAYLELSYVQNADPEGVNGQLAKKLLEQYFPSG
jgi:tetratricopeptide (TPR) repeat protein